MNELLKRAAYLKGLADGFKINDSTNEGKLMLEILETLEMFATAMNELAQENEELCDYVEDLDDSISELEHAFLEEDDEDDFDFDEEDDEDEDGLPDDGLIEYDCPHCDTTLFFDEKTFSMEENHLCPGCGKPIFDPDGEK